MYAERGFFRACPPFASSVESASFFPAFFFEDFFSSYFCDLSAGTAFMEAFAAPLEALEAFFPLCWSSGLRSPSFFNFELSVEKSNQINYQNKFLRELLNMIWKK